MGDPLGVDSQTHPPGPETPLTRAPDGKNLPLTQEASKIEKVREETAPPQSVAPPKPRRSDVVQTKQHPVEGALKTVQRALATFSSSCLNLLRRARNHIPKISWHRKQKTVQQNEIEMTAFADLQQKEIETTPLPKPQQKEIEATPLREPQQEEIETTPPTDSEQKEEIEMTTLPKLQSISLRGTNFYRTLNALGYNFGLNIFYQIQKMNVKTKSPIEEDLFKTMEGVMQNKKYSEQEAIDQFTNIVDSWFPAIPHQNAPAQQTKTTHPSTILIREHESNRKYVRDRIIDDGIKYIRRQFQPSRIHISEHRQPKK